MFDSAQTFENTKDKLIAAAASLLMRHSYGSVSVDDICKAADIKKGTFYHHFPSKVELSLAAYDYIAEFMRQKLDPCFSKELSPSQRLTCLADASYRFHKEIFDLEGRIYGCPVTNAVAEMGTEEEVIRCCIEKIFDIKREYLAGVVADIPAFKNASPEKIRQIASEMLAYSSGVYCFAKVANDPEIIRRDLASGLKRLAGLAEVKEEEHV